MDRGEVTDDDKKKVVDVVADKATAGTTPKHKDAHGC